MMAQVFDFVQVFLQTFTTFLFYFIVPFIFHFILLYFTSVDSFSAITKKQAQ